MKLQNYLWLLIIAPMLSGCPKDPPKDRILVFTKTDGYVHESIGAGASALDYLGRRHEFGVVVSNEATDFNSENLKKYAAVVFLSTTGDVLNTEQEKAFMEFVQAGGGFVGIHAAADTEYDWPWYGKLVGAYFESHPEQQQARIVIKDTSHLAARGIPNPWNHFNEWYNYKDISPNLNIIALLDESSYTGGTNGAIHPIAWSQEYDGGRVFYTGLGHTIESYSDDIFLDHLAGGILYVLGRSE